MRGWSIGALVLLAACADKTPPTPAARPVAPPPPSAATALNAFGLVGVFAADCANPLETAGRITYTVPEKGDPTALSEIHTVKTTYRVIAAEPVSDHAIHTTTEIVAQTGLEGPSPAPIGSRFEQIFEATDGGIRLAQSQLIGGPMLVKGGQYVGTEPAAPTPVLHKCS